MMVLCSRCLGRGDIITRCVNMCYSEIEHSDAAVCAHTGEHVPAAPRLAEGDVIHLLVMGNQLGLDVTTDHVDPPQHLASLQPPHGARGVDGGGAQQVWVSLIPVK